MLTSRVLFSALHLLVGLVLVLAGGFFAVLPIGPTLKMEIFPFIGYGLLGLGVALFAGFFLVNRGQYYQVKMSAPDVQVDPSVIQSYVQQYWGNLHACEGLETEVFVRRGNKLELVVEMPPLPLEAQHKLLERAEGEIGELLSRSVGYRRDFLVSVLIK